MTVTRALLLIVCALTMLWPCRGAEAKPWVGSRAVSGQESWGTLMAWPGVHTTYSIYRQKFIYGASPLLVTDMRTDSQYSDKESYETRGLTVYRAHDGRALRANQPVVFFVHGGAWTDGYENWYDFVAQSFTGEKGWVTAVVDYRLTSNEVFRADEHCPDRATCSTPENVAARTKAAWYADNLQDVAAALQWVASQVGANGGNPNQIVLFGHSAGGHLVSLLATHPDYASLRPAIRGVVSMSGAYRLKDLYMPAFADALNQTFHGGALHNDAELDEASPSAYVVAGLTLSPFYLLHAQTELPSLNGQFAEFRDQLAGLGLSVHDDYLLGYTHESEMEAIADAQAMPTRLIIAYVEDVLDLPGRHNVYLPLVER